MRTTLPTPSSGIGETRSSAYWTFMGIGSVIAVAGNYFESEQRADYKCARNLVWSAWNDVGKEIRSVTGLFYQPVHRD